MSLILRAIVALVLCASGLAKTVWPSVSPFATLERLTALAEIILGAAWFLRPTRTFVEQSITILLVAFVAYHGYFMLTGSGGGCGCLGSRIHVKHSTMLMLSGGMLGVMVLSAVRPSRVAEQPINRN